MRGENLCRTQRNPENRAAPPPATRPGFFTPPDLAEGRRRVRLAYLKRIYESSRGFLEVESFNTFDSHEIWLTFFDEDGWPRLRKSWGDDAFGQPDFVLARQLLLSLRFEGFPDVEAERLAAQMTVDLQEHQ
jgi:hypothetical protein